MKTKNRLVMALLLATTLLSNNAKSQDKIEIWQSWLITQINNHPDILSAKESLKAALSASTASGKPLYNPELDVSYEREGAFNNFNLGISKSFDWWNKIDVLKNQSSQDILIAQQNLNLAIQNKASDILKALVQWKARKSLTKLAIAQQQQLTTLLRLIKNRLQAGDLGQIDAELAYLSLSQALNDIANVEAELQSVESTLSELIPSWFEKQHTIPEVFWQQSYTFNDEQLLKSHPLAIKAKAIWDKAESTYKIAKIETKADPTFGVSVGQTSNSNTFGVDLTIPLNVLNNYSDKAMAIKYQSLSAQKAYLSVNRKLRNTFSATGKALKVYKSRLKRWQTLVSGSDSRISKLLNNLWQSGEMTTTEYLQALQKRTESLKAGIELQEQLQLAQLDWLAQRAQLLSTKK